MVASVPLMRFHSVRRNFANEMYFRTLLCIRLKCSYLSRIVYRTACSPHSDSCQQENGNFNFRFKTARLKTALCRTTLWRGNWNRRCMLELVYIKYLSLVVCARQTTTAGHLSCAIASAAAALPNGKHTSPTHAHEWTAFVIQFSSDQRNMAKTVFAFDIKSISCVNMEEGKPAHSWIVTGCSTHNAINMSLKWRIFLQEIEAICCARCVCRLFVIPTKVSLAVVSRPHQCEMRLSTHLTNRRRQCSANFSIRFSYVQIGLHSSLRSFVTVH